MFILKCSKICILDRYGGTAHGSVRMSWLAKPDPQKQCRKGQATLASPARRQWRHPESSQTPSRASRGSDRQTDGRGRSRSGALAQSHLCHSYTVHTRCQPHMALGASRLGVGEAGWLAAQVEWVLVSSRRLLASSSLIIICRRAAAAAAATAAAESLPPKSHPSNRASQKPLYSGKYLYRSIDPSLSR